MLKLYVRLFLCALPCQAPCTLRALGCERFVSGCMHAHRVETSADVRALWLHRLATSPAARLVSLLHGRLFPLTDLLAAAAAGEEPPQGHASGERPRPVSVQAEMPCASLQMTVPRVS
jgi:hypothetical protein